MSTQTAQTRKALPESVLRAVRDGALEAADPLKILSWGIENFHPRLALSCSFGAPEGLVLLDMMHTIDPGSRVFVLDTGRLPQETYDLMDRVRDCYRKDIEVIFPRAEAVETMVRRHGVNLFYESVEKRQRCCQVRKVDPLTSHLAALDAWVSGLRRDQNVTRADVGVVELDAVHGGMVKLNPLAAWESADVWHYVRTHGVPVNRLHKQGYPSVGCAPCSRAIQAGEDPRAGRWWWENPETKECGIHVGEESGGSGI